MNTDHKRTKIVCTIGPASWEPKVLKQMIEAGMNIARVNGAFADVNELKRVAEVVRSISTEVALMLDIKGHEVRLNKFSESLPIKPGDEVVIGSNATHGMYPVTYPGVYKEIKPGQQIIVDKGEATLEVKKVADGKMYCKVINGELIESGKGLSFPSANLTNPTLTDIDREQIKFVISDNWDFVSASYIRNAADAKKVKSIFGNSAIKLIAKIEDQSGVDNFAEILEVSDGIMIARGDMGTEMPFERLPIIQKEMIFTCNQAAKPVITATNMLESMCKKLYPTRAEITDVANAVLDGTDALMTSAETTTGKYPLETVKTMSKIAVENERYIKPEVVPSFQLESEQISVSISKAAFEVVDHLDIKAVLVVSQTGTFARIIARNDLPVPIFAFVQNESHKRQLQLTKNIQSFVFPKVYTDRDNAIEGLINYAVDNKLLSKTDKILIIGRASMSKSYFPNIFEYVDLKMYFEERK